MMIIHRSFLTLTAPVALALVLTGGAPSWASASTADGDTPPSAEAKDPAPDVTKELLKKGEAFIASLGTKAIHELTDPKMTDNERRKKFRTMFEDNFDVKATAKFALGRYARTISDEDFATYLELFTLYLTDVYAAKFKNYHNEQFKIVRSMPHRDKKGLWIISQIQHPDGSPPNSIKWLVIPQKDGALKIYDVVVEGISMGTTLRSEHTSILSQNKGKISALIEPLRHKVNNN